MSTYVPTPVDDWLANYSGPRKSRSPKRADGQSYGAAMTERKRNMLASGIHPATSLALRAGLAESCGTCTHCIVSSNGNRHWFKCNLVPITNGSGTDIRLKWPACIKWEKGDGKEERFRAH